MLVRLGYACISKTLVGVTSSTNYTYTSFNKDNNFDKLDRVIRSNLEDLIEILKYNYRNDIHFYRLSSNIIPLATHNMVMFDYIDKYKCYYNKISHIVSNMRVDMHTNAYCVLNSVRKEVVDNTIENLRYHYNLLEAMNIKNKLIILHVGGNTFGKNKSITRFINNFKKLPKYLRDVIVIENDDKVFNVDDCIYISNKLGIPIVLDYHHFLCNNMGKDIDYYLEDIFKSWQGSIAKMHFSTPKSKKEYRSHNDYIDVDKFIEFIEILKKYDKDVDIMLEAKNKDEALFRLVRQLKYKTDYRFIDGTSFEV